MNNFILKTDSYKVTHWPQYEPGTETVHSYFESRGGYSPWTEWVGLQGILKKHFVGQVVSPAMIDEAETLLGEHFGRGGLVNMRAWRHIVHDHGGRLPLSIRAAAEGLRITVRNVLMTVENTCPQCYWLTNYAETLLTQVWYPTTVATYSRHVKDLILSFLEKNGDPAGIGYKLHDFGFRGASSVESAAIGGFAHLVNFFGTDTLPALIEARDYYNAKVAAGHSIPASEHSTITSWGKNRELDACRNMLEQYPTGLMACVSDSFDIYKLCRYGWGGALKAEVLARDGCLVVRPDSGDPTKVVFDVVEMLGECLGFTRNAKGYKVLDSHVRVIQGDGVNLQSIAEILAHLHAYGWSADNVAFGMGGALLQKLDRDTHKHAFKCSFVAGKFGERDVWKDPVTDPGKASKRGRLALARDGDGEWHTISGPHPDDELQEVFRDGELRVDQSLDAIRSASA